MLHHFLNVTFIIIIINRGVNFNSINNKDLVNIMDSNNNLLNFINMHFLKYYKNKKLNNYKHPLQTNNPKDSLNHLQFLENLIVNY